MREVSDRLCREYGISVIEYPGGKEKHYAEWQAERNGKPTHWGSIRADIDWAILASTTERDFIRVMTEMGYQFKTHGKGGKPIAHQYGAAFHTDAVQAVGHIPVDVKALGVDLLSASGHKFNGPKGVGFLYIKKGTPLRLYADGGSQEFGFRAGTENVAAIIAMACALKKNCARLVTVSERLSRMERAFLHILDQAGIDYLRNGAKAHIPGNLNISIRGASGETLLHRLDLKGICVSTGSACDSVNTQVSHVIQAIGVQEEYARGTIRISFGSNNEESDAIAVATALIDILRKH